MAFSCAILSSHQILEATGGRIIAFISRIDNKGPGAHAAWDQSNLYNTDNEKAILSSGFNSYWEMSQNLIKARITVDIFACSHS